jgi:hypothetical protein
MVKLVYCLRRLSHLSREEFQTYWRENHGQLVRRTAGPVNIRRYVQIHTVDFQRRAGARQAIERSEPFDGVAELWWDSAEDFAPENPSRERQQSIAAHVEDERRFIDLSESPLWLAEEHPFIEEVPEAPVTDGQPDSRVKLVYCLHRLPHLSREEFQTYWRENHGPLVQRHREALSIRRYVQVHTKYNEVNETLQAGQDRPEAFDGVAELWWDSVEEYAPENPGPERQEAGWALFEDEQKFIDLSRSPVWLGREYVFIGNV